MAPTRILGFEPGPRLVARRVLNFPPPLVGATPLWLAARFGEADFMRLPAEDGADPSSSTMPITKQPTAQRDGWSRRRL